MYGWIWHIKIDTKMRKWGCDGYAKQDVLRDLDRNHLENETGIPA
jgi:hypothetical protein